MLNKQRCYVRCEMSNVKRKRKKAVWSVNLDVASFDRSRLQRFGQSVDWKFQRNKKRNFKILYKQKGPFKQTIGFNFRLTDNHSNWLLTPSTDNKKTWIDTNQQWVRLNKYVVLSLRFPQIKWGFCWRLVNINNCTVNISINSTN